MRGEIVRVRRLGAPTGAYDDQGNPVLASSTEFAVDGAALAPIGADETAQEFGPQVITGYQCYFRSELALLPSDELQIRDEWGWQVDGLVGDWVSPYAVAHRGVEFRVRRSS